MSDHGMVEITRCNLARGNIITAAYLGIQRVNNEKGGATFENAEIMPYGPQEGEGRRPARGDTVTRVPGRARKTEIFWDTHAGPFAKRAKEWRTREADAVRIDSGPFCARVGARTARMCRDI